MLFDKFFDLAHKQVRYWVGEEPYIFDRTGQQNDATGKSGCVERYQGGCGRIAAGYSRS